NSGKPPRSNGVCAEAPGLLDRTSGSNLSSVKRPAFCKRAQCGSGKCGCGRLSTGDATYNAGRILPGSHGSPGASDGGGAMNLLRALHAESLKMKRTIALAMVVLCPTLIVLLI